MGREGLPNIHYYIDKQHPKAKEKEIYVIGRGAESNIKTNKLRIPKQENIHKNNIV